MMPKSVALQRRRTRGDWRNYRVYLRQGFLVPRSLACLESCTNMRRLVERYRLPESFLKYSCSLDPATPQGFFTLGEGTVCFGSCSGDKLAASVEDGLCDVRDRVRFTETPCICRLIPINSWTIYCWNITRQTHRTQ